MNEKQINENSALKENQLDDSMGVQKQPGEKEKAILGNKVRGKYDDKGKKQKELKRNRGQMIFPGSGIDIK